MTIVDHDDWWEWRAPGARAAFTSREVGDVRSDGAARARAAALLDLDPGRVAAISQVHGADVWVDLGTGDGLPAEVRWDARAAAAEGDPIEADALITTRPGVALAIVVADCLPIAITWGDAVAAVHAGWRSLDGGVVEAALAALRRRAGSSVALADAGPFAVVGPALCVDCFEVGEEVAARFAASAVVRRPEWPRPHLDARTDAARRLAEAGCAVEHVNVCTRCDPRLFSHRGDGPATGRQAVLVRR
ncbi:MAG: laccase protein [Thermoleophilia bacterium]|nr:laccase protein [Thermoleophilia bacterium]